jgi:fatty acid desaturase
MEMLAEKTEQTMSYKDVLPEAARALIKEAEHASRPWHYVLRTPIFYTLWAIGAAISIRWPTLAVRIPVAIGLGFVFGGFLMMMHDCLHQSFSRSSRVNHWVGFISAAPTLFAYSAYRHVHNRHHACPRTVDDPDDFQNMSPNRVVVNILYYGSFLLGVGSYVLMTFAKTVAEGRRGAKFWVIVEMAAIAAWVATSIAVAMRFGWVDHLVWIWGVPWFLGQFFLNLRSISEHTGTQRGDNPVALTRTITSNAVYRFFLVNENFHTIHHLAPRVPGFAYEGLHRELRPMLLAQGMREQSSYIRFLAHAIKRGPFGVDPPGA